MIAWFTALFVLAIGVANGGSDQAVYLLQGIARANPDYLPGDWFTWDTAPVHEVFGLVIAAFSRVNALEIGITVGAVAQSALLAVAVYWGIRAVYDRPLLPWALSMLLLAAVGTRGLGLSRLINPHMQASAIGGVCLLTGLVLLAWDKRFRAGLTFGLGGLIHAHFAVLTLAVLTLVTLGEKPPRRRFIRDVWLPFLALSSYNLVQAVSYALKPGSDRSTAIALARFPHHLSPSTWRAADYGFFLIALLVGALAWRVRRPGPNGRLGWALVSLIFIVISSVAIGYTPWLESVNLAFPWRLSTFVVLACVALGSAAVCAPEPRKLSTPFVASLAGLAAMVVLLVASPVLPGRVAVAAATALLVPASLVVARRLNLAEGRRAALGRITPFLLVTMGFLPAVIHGLELSHLDLRPDDPARSELYSWVRASTPVGAVFAVPPGWKDFRLVAERPIVADHKATPLNSRPDLVAWYERLHDLTGVAPANNVDELDEAFFALSCDRADTLRSRYRLRFVIRESGVDLSCGSVAYSDDRYAVYDLAP